MTNGMQTVIKNPSWWRRRTALEKTLTLLSIVGILAVIALAISLIYVLCVQKDKNVEKSPSVAQALDGPPGVHLYMRPMEMHDHKDDNVCLTTECIHTASRVLNKMDQSVEPCDDFYQYACGNFLKETIIPDDKVSVNVFSDISDKLQEQLRTLISEEVKPDESKPFRLAKDLFAACNNKTRIEEEGFQPLYTIYKNVGEWPVVQGDKWDEKGWDWVDTVLKFRKYGFSPDYILDFSVSIDYKNSSKRVIDIDQASIGLSREYLIKGKSDKLVQSYFSYMVDLSVLLGADRERATKELDESLNFEIALANISLPTEKRRNATQLYNPMPIKDVQAKYPYVKWLEYINALLPKNLTVDENETVVVSVPTFFESLGPLLEKTPKRAIANYMMWRISAFATFFMNEKLRKRQLQYTTEVSGKQEEEPRWKECIDITSGSLSISVGALYVRKYFQENSKQTALQMVTDIRNEFKKILTSVTWMDDLTRKEALRKAEAMTTHIGYPDEIMDNKKLEEYYDGLEIDSNKYLESVLRINVFGTDLAFNKLKKPVNKTDWVTHARPAVVNAFYSSIENSIQFPAGILQGQFFNADRPKYMNYGAIGYVIGHEITHGFDDQGRQFDLNGNLKDWWQQDTKTNFLEKARCIIDQYGNYTDEQTTLNLNGINTQGENIADNGGIKESYLAYKNWASAHGPEQKLPGIHHTPEQMFWLAAAQTWCSVYRTEALKLRITTGFHSPGEFRVLGPMSNLPYFSKDFNCPENSKMNPTHKCEVW